MKSKLGGYSTRPGAEEITIEEELNRVLPAIRFIANEYPEIIVSIDTFRSEVAHAAIEAGAHIVNDVSGGNADENMFKIIAELAVPMIIMHSKGTPKTMQSLTEYQSIFSEIAHYFSVQIAKARLAGIRDIIIDPGFGFAKTIEGNFELLHWVNEFQLFNCMILVGVSRKSMIHKTLDIKPEESLNGSTALHTFALMKGAAIIRVHDTKEAQEVIELVEKSRRNDLLL